MSVSPPFAWKWTYMDHWRSASPRGPVTPLHSRREMDRFIKQLAALGIRGIDTFFFNLYGMQGLFGSLQTYETFLRDRGIEKIVSVFNCRPYAAPDWAPHDRRTHDGIVADCRRILDQCDGLAIENLIVMPTNTHWHMAPLTEDKQRAVAEVWGRVGQICREQYGVRLAVHHEFWGAVRTLEEIDHFYAWTDPRDVWFFCDAAQHVIAGLDPVALYRRLHHRTAGFHFKDTRNIDTRGEYALPPDAELLAPSVRRWFYEMGTPGGKVDFPALVSAMHELGYRGWVGVEHDKADTDGGSYAETTANAMWFAQRALGTPLASPPEPAAAPIRFAYAVNQWKLGHDLFVREDERLRAMKTIAASGIDAIELHCGSGRWEPMGRRDAIELHHGSLANFRQWLADAGIRAVSSFYFDCAMFMQEDSSFGRSPAREADHAGIVAAALPYAEALQALGGDMLVVKPSPAWWQLPQADAATWRSVAACWNAVATAIAPLGVRVALHLDAVGALRSMDDIELLLSYCDTTVGLALDTAEATIAGFDPLALIARWPDRVLHVQLKNTREVDEHGEYRLPAAEHALLGAGGRRGIERWFHELDVLGGRVDAAAVVQALKAVDYRGWLVIESDHSPEPASSALLNAWTVQRVLRPVLAAG